MKLVYFLSRDVTSRCTSASIRIFSDSLVVVPFALVGGGTYLKIISMRAECIYMKKMIYIPWTSQVEDKVVKTFIVVTTLRVHR